jgi:hypothetical protein
MKITLSDKIIAWLALLSGLTISAVAIWYSVAGLVSIFAAAVIPIIVMGVVLEVSKLIATVWLKINWTRAPIFIRTYLLVAIAILMVITSMGIFGFLSKAHSDQSLVSGDVQSKIAVYDEKIKVAKDNVDANRKALKQMDEAVDQVMGRSQDEKGADKAVALRRAQTKERTRLLSEITTEQKTIAALSEERAPIAAEVRKVEAEVGPIKYIAAFVYGDNPDANVLEKAVTWVIIIIVSVFDPLAVILLLASQYSFQWFRRAREDDEQPQSVNDIVPQPQTLVVDEQLSTITPTADVVESPIEETPITPWPFPVQTVPDKSTTQMDLFAEQPVVQPEDDFTLLANDDDLEIIEASAETEKQAMKAWKHDNPTKNLKLQKRLFNNGTIDKLPWDNYLKPETDFVESTVTDADSEAAAEAAKWAQEQIEKAEQSKKKDNDLDGASGRSASQEDQRRLAGYVQNAEQTDSTIWQRVKHAKENNDR